MKFTMQVDMDNAAFETEFGDMDNPELVRILEVVKKSVRDGVTDSVVRDINGNKVGNWMISEND